MMRMVLLASIAATVTGNCAAAPYAFCCGVGVKCDCGKGISAAGQCAGDIKVPILGKVTSYAYCCGIGTPCVCGLSDDNNTQMEV